MTVFIDQRPLASREEKSGALPRWRCSGGGERGQRYHRFHPGGGWAVPKLCSGWRHPGGGGCRRHIGDP